MRRRQGNRPWLWARTAYLLVALSSVATLSLALAPDALARYGRGLIGETTDKTVTFTGLLFICGMVVLITLLSLLQWRLDKRKAARKAAEHAHVADIDWRGGW
jgi:uncharacterized membrane protein YidH (DUF202 family)